jgi:excinuclease ABC subunit A
MAFQGEKKAVAEEIVREILSRLSFLSDVGVGYLTLDRPGGSLSGGESQRIHLASQLGSDLTGVMYILDEPSIGLHPRDTGQLVETLRSLRDSGNTIIVVEHDPGIIRSADHLVDFGPGAGVGGGDIVFSGSPKMILDHANSLTGAYLSGRKEIPVPQRRRRPGKKVLRVIGAGHNNLKDVTCDFPLGLFTCVTGVSGAGKSSLVNQVLYPALHNRMRRRTRIKEGECRRITGLEHVGRIVLVDQKPIGKTPRSNPIIYTGAFNHVRELFASLREARAYGYDKSRFSFNLKGGRCEACQGDGLKRIEMHFLPDVFVPCDLCGGARYNQATLKVRYKGYTIADILDLTVSEALDLFKNQPPVVKPLSALADVGLDYIRLGKPSTTLS